MTVAELIAELQKENPEAIVFGGEFDAPYDEVTAWPRAHYDRHAGFMYRCDENETCYHCRQRIGVPTIAAVQVN